MPASDAPRTRLFGPGTAGPFDAEIDEADAIDILGLDAVAGGILDGEAGDERAIAGDEQAFGVSGLAGEIEDGGIGTCTDQRDVGDIEAEALLQAEAAWAEADGVAGAGGDECLLQPLAIIAAGLDADGAGLCGAAHGQCHAAQCQAAQCYAACQRHCASDPFALHILFPGLFCLDERSRGGRQGKAAGVPDCRNGGWTGGWAGLSMKGQ
jgi:hypothetical protein